MSSIDFLQYVLENHKEDSKTASYIAEVERITNMDISESEMYRKLVNESAVRVDIDTPDWDGVSRRTLLHQLYKEAGNNRGYIGNYGSLYELIVPMVAKGLYGKHLLENYTKEEIDQIGQLIDPEKDDLFTYAGLRMLADRYIAKDHDGNVYELPQERFIMVAMTTLINENKDMRLKYIAEAYWALSNLYMTVATPTFANSGKTHGQLSSCFIDTVEDSLDGIFLNNWDSARVSKNGGGMGIYLGKVRALHSTIRGFKNKASGVIPWIKGLNNTATSVDQLGQRQGAFALYLDLWHKDIFSFLQVGTNNGDERMKAYDIFTGICIPDLFMELSEADENSRMITPDAPWYLFDPYEVEQLMGFRLEDLYDEHEGSGSWREAYKQCIEHPLLSRIEVPVKDVVKAILTAQLETGHPYMFYRDEVNRKNANSHKGMIYCSNLCTEIAQNMSATSFVEEHYDEELGKIVSYKNPGDYVVCNLSSINLGTAVTDGVIKRLIMIQVRMLDNVIDVNNLPLEQARVTNMRYRPVGLGTYGWHQLLSNMGIDWDDERSVDLADEIYEKVAYYSINASKELAKEKGAYPYFKGSDWDTGEYFTKRGYDDLDWTDLKEEVQKYGMRNGYLLAVAPNSSTALIAGSTQGIDPFYGAQGIYFEEKKDFKLPIMAPDLTPETYQYYFRRNAHYVSQEVSIKQNAKRQRHIDQAISFNIYVPSDVKAKDLMQLHRLVWRNKIKTSYYTRGTANLVDDCEACQ